MFRTCPRTLKTPGETAKLDFQWSISRQFLVDFHWFSCYIDLEILRNLLVKLTWCGVNHIVKTLTLSIVKKKENAQSSRWRFFLFAASLLLSLRCAAVLRPNRFIKSFFNTIFSACCLCCFDCYFCIGQTWTDQNKTRRQKSFWLIVALLKNDWWDCWGTVKTYLMVQKLYCSQH